MEKALNYQFKLSDLNKYYRDINPKDTNFRFTTSAKGSHVPDFEQRQRKLFEHSYLNKLLHALKGSDWAAAPIYHHFLRHGYLKHDDPTVFSDIELKCLHSTLHSMTTGRNEKEFTQTEGKQIVAQKFAKLMRTVEFLMSLFNMQYYFQKIRAIFAEGQREPDLFQLNKLIVRSLKLYQMADSFTKVFKLIRLLEKIEAKLSAKPGDEKLLETEHKMRRRLVVVIKLLLKDHPILPTNFRFNGECLIQKLKRQEEVYLGKQESSLGLSSRQSPEIFRREEL